MMIMGPLSDGAHRTPASPLPFEGTVTVRVRYSECDPQGVAHHSSYIPWLELARTELLRGTPTRDPDTGFVRYEGGFSYAEMERAGIVLVVAKLSMSYKAPAFYDRLLEVRACVAGGGRARLDHEYEVWELDERGTRARLLSVASSTLASVGPDGRPKPLPEWLRVGRADRSRPS
jgi:acyl-CoA thioester hydrolase